MDRQVYLPLEKISKCSLCGRFDLKLRLCASCAEVLYCSKECQNKDWKSHKVQCGNTDRIDLGSFHPLLACVIHISHLHPDVPHPALTHKILNSPVPGKGEIVEFPNGTRAKLVLLGEEIAPELTASPTWWPTAPSAEVRHKLMRRISSEGFLLPILLATCISLVSELYTTTAAPPSEMPGGQSPRSRRIRLTHNRSPIADFGIAKGHVRVTAEDRLAYYNIEENELMMGQDPKNHYWIYFTTLAGEEYFLECGMMNFNFAMMVDATPYCKYGLPSLKYVPAFFYGREHLRMMPLTEATGWKARERFSMLRNAQVSDFVKQGIQPSEDFSARATAVVCSLLETIAGRPPTALEMDLVMKFIPNACMIVRLNIVNREYINFPQEPSVIVENDPGESINYDMPAGEDEAFGKYMKKWSRRYKKGKVSEELLSGAFKRWMAKPHEARMKMAGWKK
ncbi:hypothetical protein B0H34DRAFT_438197 [Crassisporium funariophilum]|nr:hypothetical protein B0H34DRAFT_438197 [Crassisporium funariophilum]